MYFTINVALNGLHYFATAERSITSEDVAIAMTRTFRRKFPPVDGYSVTVSRVDTVSTPIDA